MKTKTSRRVLVLPLSVVAMLKKRRAQQRVDGNESRFVFPDSDGGPRAPEAIRTTLRAVLKADDPVRWEHVSPKTLRATHATVVKTQTDLWGAARRLGHADIDTLQKHYLATPTVSEKVLAVVDDFMA